MKKKIVALVIIINMFLIFLFMRGNDNNNYYKERISSYEKIAKYALQNYDNSDGSRECVYLSDITDDELAQSISVAEEKFDYIWIENDSVIFWNHEMKTLGLIYSDNVRRAIRDIEEWYDDLDKEKINKNCYLIGQLNTI